MRPGHARTYLVLVFMPLFFVSNLIIGRAAATAVEPWTLAFWRWLVAVLLLVPVAWPGAWSCRQALTAQWPLLLLQGFFGVWVCGGLVYVSLDFTTATHATLIYTTTPVLIVVLEAALFGTALSPARAAGVAAAVLGVVTIVLEGNPAALIGLKFNIGDLGMVIAAIAWAIYSLVLRRRGMRELPMLPLFFAIAVAGTLTVLPFAIWEMARSGLPTGLWPWLSILGLAVVPSIFGSLTFQYGVQEVGPATTSVFMYLLPIYGMGLAVLLLGEPLHVYHAVGLVLVVLGVALATWPGSPLKAAARAPSA